ncbi:MAG: DUF6077 domain-containing protein [Pseudomonadota bacterium]
MHDIAYRVFLFLYAFFLVFTICSQLLTLWGAPFVTLYGAGMLALWAGGLALRLTPLLIAAFGPSCLRLPSLRVDAGAIRSRGRAVRVQAVVLAIAFVIGLAAVYRAPHDFTPFWLGCLGAAALALLPAARQATGPPIVALHAQTDAIEGPAWGWAYPLFLLVALGFYFATSVPDGDDALFLNIASGAQRSREGLMTLDTMLGIDGLGFIKSTYRLEAFIPLAALIADVLGVETILAAHAVLPVLSIAFALSVYVVVLQAFLGRHWPAALVFLLLLTLILAGSYTAYGNFGFTRFFQGKALLVSTVVPLVGALALAAILRGGVLLSALLAGAVIIGIGASANGIFLGPILVAVVAATFFLGGDRRQRLAAVALGTAVVYPAALAGYLLVFDPPAPSEFEDAGRIGTVFWSLLGRPYAVVLFLTGLFAAAAAGLMNPRLRLISLFVAVYLVCVVNPFTWDLLGRYVTGNVNFRLFWALPVPFIGAVFLGVLWQSVRAPVFRAGMLGALALGCLLPGALPQETERFRWEWSLIKVHSPEYAIAERVNAAAPPGALMLAPEAIALWLTTFDNFRPVVDARPIYTPQRAHLMPADRLRRRAALFDWITGTPVEADIPRLIDEVGVRAVLVPPGEAGAAMRPVLAASGFTATDGAFGGYGLFLRGAAE